MIRDIDRVLIEYNGTKVGQLASEDGRILFQYDSEWAKNGFSISPLSLPLDRRVHASNSKLFDGLYGVFWDSLPDGWGELMMIRYLATKGINYNNLSPLTRLTLIGDNGLGGLRYLPSQSDMSIEDIEDFDVMSSEVSKILSESDDIDIDRLYGVGGSSGGARPKAHIRIDDDYYIVKFASSIDPIDIGRDEYTANNVAKQCGIDVAECRLFPSSRCGGYFGTKRFDRVGGRRVHVVSLAGLLETTHRTPNLDYGHLFNIVMTLTHSHDEMYEAFRRMCYNVYYGNKDDHSKNFAFMYDESIGRYRLTPAYDLTKTPNKYEHEMTVNGAGNPTENDMMTLCRDFEMDEDICLNIMHNIASICAKSNVK